jgi:nucleotide-binding universal stress UspA family protein
MYARILVPIDDGPAAQRGLDEAIAIARRLGASLRVLRVTQSPTADAEVSTTYAPPSQLVEDLRIAGERLVPDAVARARAHGASVDGTVRCCDPTRRMCDVIAHEAKRAAAELIVIGARAGHEAPHSVRVELAALVMQASPVPVLVVPARDCGGP